LHDPDSGVREAAVASLAQLADKRATDPLIHALQDPQHEVRWRAARALDMLGWQPENDDQIVMRAVAAGDLVKTIGIGSAAVGRLTAVLNDARSPNRRAVVEALGQIGDTRAIKALTAAVKDADPTVRVYAIDALRDARDGEVTKVLLAALGDQDQHVRGMAAAVLGRIGDPSVVEPLLGLLGDANWSVRKAAVESIGRLKDPRAVEALTVLLKDSDHDVREVAVAALGEIGDPWEKAEAARNAIPELKVALQSNEYWVRHSASEVLAKLDKIYAAEPELTAMNTAIRLRQQVAIDAMLKALSDYDSDLRMAAAEALGRICDARLTRPLAAALDDADQWVRQAAGRALERMGWIPSNDAQHAQHQAALQLQPFAA
jgi:HEAT repeat protein